MISLSIVDYIGKIKDGVAILLSLNIDDVIYEMIFWINKENKYVLSVDEKLLKLLNVESIYDYENLDDLLYKIFQLLPKLNDLFSKFENA